MTPGEQLWQDAINAELAVRRIRMPSLSYADVLADVERIPGFEPYAAAEALLAALGGPEGFEPWADASTPTPPPATSNCDAIVGGYAGCECWGSEIGLTQRSQAAAEDHQCTGFIVRSRGVNRNGQCAWCISPVGGDPPKCNGEYLQVVLGEYNSDPNDDDNPHCTRGIPDLDAPALSGDWGMVFPNPGLCRVEVWAHRIGAYHLDVAATYFHLHIVVTGSDGAQVDVGGGPQPECPRGAASWDGVRPVWEAVQFATFGYLQGELQTIEAANAVADPGPGLSVVLASGSALCARLDSLVRSFGLTIERVNEACHRYSPYPGADGSSGVNSNSLAFTLLSEAGLPLLSPVDPASTPGWGILL